MIAQKWFFLSLLAAGALELASQGVQGAAAGETAKAPAQIEKETAEKVQDRAAKRLARLAEYLEQRAGVVTDDASAVRSAVRENVPESALKGTLAKARGYAQTAKEAIEAANERGAASNPKAVAGGVLTAVYEKAKTFRDYAKHLRQLTETVKTAAPEEALSKLDEAYVPPDVEDLLTTKDEAPLGPPGEATAAPDEAPAAESAPEAAAQPPTMTRGVASPRAALSPAEPALGGQAVSQYQLLTQGSGRVAGTGAKATVDYPSVVAVQTDISSDQTPHFVPWCTGTLIAPNVVLSAAHCFCEYEQGQKTTEAKACRAKTFTLNNGAQLPALDPSYRRVFLQHGGAREIERVEIHDDYQFPKADLSLVFLKAPVFDVQPIGINTAGPVAHGTVARIVGFGRHSMLDQLGAPIGELAGPDAGLKFHARTTTSPCKPQFANSNLICWHFSGSGALPQSVRTDGNTCSGDSGGPLFANDASGAAVLVGVTSGGMQTNCGAGDDSFDVEVYAYRDWIGAALAANPAAAAAEPAFALHPLDRNATRFHFAKPTWQFHPSSQLYSWRLVVPAGARKVRISLNSDRVLQTPLRLRLVDGAGAVVKNAAGEPVCDIETEHAAAACETVTPFSADLRLEASGPGSKWFQIVATGF